MSSLLNTLGHCALFAVQKAGAIVALATEREAADKLCAHYDATFGNADPAHVVEGVALTGVTRTAQGALEHVIMTWGSAPNIGVPPAPPDLEPAHGLVSHAPGINDEPPAGAQA